jgi:hypothetical protein
MTARSDEEARHDDPVDKGRIVGKLNRNGRFGMMAYRNLLSNDC